MPISVVSIKARHEPIGTGNVSGLIQQAIGASGFAGGMVRRMADYPPQQPTPYRRTGSLGRNWRFLGVHAVGNDLISEAGNNTRYVVYVQGPKNGRRGGRQTAVMAGKGWKNITDESRAEWAKWRPLVVRILQQRDSRVGRGTLRS